MKTYFPVVEVHNGPELPEQLGTKEKFWLRKDDGLYLVKFGREGTGEDWAEKVVCELCELLDIPHAHYDLAVYMGRKCVLSKSITADTDRLVLGNELINRISPEYDIAMSYRQQQHTVSRVLAALSKFTSSKNNSWFYFLGYLMLDALVGNTDRHHENWGLINNRGVTISLAPTFDHASSLGRELTDEIREARLSTKDRRYSVGAFASKATSALYEKEHDRTPLTTIDAFRSAASKLPADWADQWLAKLNTVSDSDVLGILDRIPPNFMSISAKRFAVELLAQNRARLLGGGMR